MNFRWGLKLRQRFILNLATMDHHTGFLCVKKSRAWPKKLRFFLFLISFALFFDEDNIVKVGIEHAVCEEIAATDG